MPQVRLDLCEADGQLPPVCIVCGAPAYHYRTKRMSYWPRWTIPLFFVHPYLWGLGLIAFSKSARVRAPFCHQHQRHWSSRRRLIWWVGAFLGTAAGLGFIAASHFHEPGAANLYKFACVGVSAGLIFWLILVAIVHATEVGPAVITNTEIVLKGVSEEFVEAVQEADRARLERIAAFTLAEEISPEHPGLHADAIQGERRGSPPIHRDSIKE